MFAALSCAATMVIQIPIATGYLNFGDGLCLLAGWILGPWYGFAAAGLGSALAAVSPLPSAVGLVLGSFGYKALILGKGLSAAASIPNNLVQAAIGIVLSVLLYTALSKVPEIHKAFWKGE